MTFWLGPRPLQRKTRQTRQYWTTYLQVQQAVSRKIIIIKQNKVEKKSVLLLFSHTHERALPACSAPCPPLRHPPLPRFPCTRCLGERSRAIVIQYCQTWRRSYNPSGFLVSRLPGVMVLLGMDASSSLSKYPFQRRTHQVIRLVSYSNKVTAGLMKAFLSLPLSLSTAKKPRVQPGCIQWVARQL